MSGPIFGSSNALGGSSGNRHLVEFRAGRMNLVNKMVHPDNRKGLVYIYQAEDGLIHFCWKDRTTGSVEDDLIVFPDDCEFKKIDNAKNGRVYLLKFKSSTRKLFFWMQEPKTDKDDEWCRRINEIINHPPSQNSLGGRGGGADSGDLQYMLNNMSQQQLMQLFGGVGQVGGLSNLLGSMNRPSSGSSRTSAASPASRNSALTVTSGTASTPTTASSAAPTTPRAPRKSSNESKTSSATPASSGNSSENSRVLLSELQNYLAGINTSGAGSSRRQIDLSTALNSESLASILMDSEKVKQLAEHLPEIEGDENKKQQLKDTLASPQFQQALSSFSSALQSGQLGPVVSQFELHNEVVTAANSGDLEQFVKALEKHADKKDGSTKATSAASSEAAADENGGTQKESKKDDNEMNLG